MRQLHVVPRFPVGTHTFILWQICAAVQAGHHVRVLAGKNGDVAGNRLARELGLREDIVAYADCRSSALWSWSIRRFSRSVREAARRKLFGHLLAERRKTFFSDLLSCPEIVDTELVQSHFVGRAIEVGIPLAKLLGVPVVVTAHSPVADFETEQLAYVQEHANAVVVPSDAERQHWIERTGSDRKLFRVWNGAPPAVAVSPMVVESASPIRLLSVSRLSPEKRVEDLVAAMACLRDMGCTCEMDVFGDGPLRAKIEALILEHGLCDSMRLRGAAPHTEVMAHLSASHALVHAADSETFGLVLIEAMSAQVPVVAARSSGAADVVVDGETGFLVPCRDPAALAQRVASLAADPGLRRRLGLAGRQRFEREFSLTAHMKNIERVWAHVLS